MNNDPDRLSDRRSYIWLALGTVFLLLSTGGFRVALAAWVAPAFLIRFYRTYRMGRGFLLIVLGVYVAMAIAWRGTLSAIFDWPVYLVFILVVAIQFSLPYLVDRWLAPRVPGFAATLVYPLAVTAGFFLVNRVNPMGSFGTVGYEQYNNLTLLQLVSITGLWGLTFLVSWCGPVVNWAWERSFQWPRIWQGFALWSGVVGVVLIFGGLRLAFPKAQPGTVQIHGLSVETDEGKKSLLFTDIEAYRGYTQDLHERLIQGTIQQAGWGAQLVLWPEMAAFGVAEDIDQLIERGQAVARQEDIYLAMGLEIHFPGQERPWENKLVLIAPSGAVLIDHDKYGATMLYNMVGAGAVLQGEYAIQSADTPFGTMSGIVCWDADFPITVRQAGKQNTDILLIANGDARSVAELHAQQHIFRAVENGFSLVRHDFQVGYSLAADPYGRILAQVDLLNAAEPVMIVQVPTQGVFTLYPVIGDLFAWLSVLGILGLIGWAVAVRRLDVSDQALMDEAA